MMMHAYNELYLNDAKERLAVMFDYAINELHEEADWFAGLFIQSGYAEKFEVGNPGIVAGKSGKEIARDIMYFAYGEVEEPECCYVLDRTPEYWAGHVLAEYQWFTGRNFRDILKRIPFSRIVTMYKIYHEMDIRQFIDSMESMYKEFEMETKLKTIRENRGLSQMELSVESGVHIRSIQMYEQRVNSIDKAQAQTLYKLARVLGCKIEDLLENPLV